MLVSKKKTQLKYAYVNFVQRNLHRFLCIFVFLCSIDKIIRYLNAKRIIIVWYRNSFYFEATHGSKFSEVIICHRPDVNSNVNNYMAGLRQRDPKYNVNRSKMNH